MERLIHEMSYLFTKQRFMELREAASQTAISNSDLPECFGSIAEGIEEFLEENPDDEWREHEKILMHYVAMRALTLWGNGDNPMLMPTRLLSMFARARVLGA
ncbi:hypothetical protein [Enterobacter sp. 166D1]|uniref:hypothetical protein n=1 Tax=Enterobacter TaxID=547 RepID=UPI002A82023F|nr:hypothetical protein [Enterobacter sp. 166D1]